MRQSKPGPIETEHDHFPTPADWHKVIGEVVERVRAYTGGSLGWIAKQSVSEHQPYDDLYGFVIGRGFAAVRLSDAVNADDALIRQLATDIMGYAPESVEDYEAKRKDAIERASEISDSLCRDANRLEYFLSVARGCEIKLQALRNANPEKERS